MNVTKNERGYALIIVLLLVVLITSMSAVFMRGAISNAKQGQRVDKNHLSVVSAEMGVDYYATSFTNRYYEVKDLYWNDAVQRYKSEIEHPDFKGDAKAAAAKYDLELKNKIVAALREVNDQELPVDVLFEMGPTAFVVNSSANPLLINGKVTGEYLDGKASVLELDMKFDLPSVLGDAGDDKGPPVDESNPKPEIGGGSIVTWPGYTYKPFEIPLVETITPITVNQESDVMGGLYQNKNVTIRKKTKLSLDSVQGNKGFVSIVSPEDIYTPKLYQNEDVETQTNGDFQTGQIQGNTGYLKIMGKNSVQVDGGSFDSNENVSVSTNGNFQAKGGMQSNTGYLNINATNGIQIKNLNTNHSIDILTNGKFQVDGAVENNKDKYLYVRATQGFQSENLSSNKNVQVLTNGGFNTGDVWSNSGKLIVKARDKVQLKGLKSNNQSIFETNSEFQSAGIDANQLGIAIFANEKFQSDKIEHNKMVDIQTNKEFHAKGIEDNKEYIKIYSKEKFQSTNQVQSNTNMDLYSGKSMQIDGKVYQNSNANISSNQSYYSKEVDDNTSLKIISGSSLTIDGVLNNNKTSATFISKGDFYSKQVQSNDNLLIKSDGEVKVDGVLNYNLMKNLIYGKGKIEAKEIQFNKNMVIYSDKKMTTNNQDDGEILIKGMFYGNHNSTFYSKGKFTSGNIQGNENIKVVSLGDFKASYVNLGTNSMICAAKGFEPSSPIVDPTSFIYVRNAELADSNKRIFYVDEEQWKEKCSVNLDFPTDEGDKDKPDFVDPGTGGWKRPSIDVKYDPILDSK